MKTTKTLSAGAAAGFAALLIAGCGASSGGSSPTPDSSGAVIPASWYATVDEQFDKLKPESSTPVIDLDAKCELEVDLEVAGSGTEEFGAGASTVGDGGKRYVCDFRKPSSHLVVATLTTQTDYDEAVDSLKAESQAGNEQTEETFTVDGRSIRVVKFVYPTNDSHIDYEASVVDPTNKGYAVLDIETTDDLKQSYTSRQAAEDLSSLLKG